MAIFQITPNELKALSETSFGVEGIMERKDIQRLLRDQISVLGPHDTSPGEPDGRFMVIAEEFGDWVDSSRRIDLLCIDAEANLVVVELKRTDDGGHMELQALRYAAMVSQMTFEQLVGTHARYKNKLTPDVEVAQSSILQFLGWDEPQEELFAQDTRIVLASADFSKELTTAVMWLRERKIDIRCVRMKPYRMAEGTLLLDVQQLIPLPEASELWTQIGVKKQAERENRTERRELRYKFWEAMLELAKTKTVAHANRKPIASNILTAGAGRSGFLLIYRVRRYDSEVELWIGLGTGQMPKNTAAFNTLEAQKSAIEADFGGELTWQESPEGEGYRIGCVIEGGYRSPPEQWPAIHEKLVDAMVRLEKTMRQRVVNLSF